MQPGRRTPPRSCAEAGGKREEEKTVRWGTTRHRVHTHACPTPCCPATTTTPTIAWGDCSKRCAPRTLSNRKSSAYNLHELGGMHTDTMVELWQTFVDQLYEFVTTTEKMCQDCERASYWRTVKSAIPEYQYRGRPHRFFPTQYVRGGPPPSCPRRGAVAPRHAPGIPTTIRAGDSPPM